VGKKNPVDAKEVGCEQPLEGRERRRRLTYKGIHKKREMGKNKKKIKIGTVRGRREGGGGKNDIGSEVVNGKNTQGVLRKDKQREKKARPKKLN